MFLTWQHPLPDDSVLASEDVVTPDELVVKLIFRISIPVEAELPEAHVLELAVRVLVGDQPVRAVGQYVRYLSHAGMSG